MITDRRVLLFVTLSSLSMLACKPDSSSSNAPPAASLSTVLAPTLAASSAPGAAGIAIIAVKVDGDGFTPSSATFKKGEHAQLIFTRTSDKTCAKEVVFPELDLKKALPLNEAVAIDVPTADARTLSFQCGMGMYKSTVTIR